MDLDRTARLNPPLHGPRVHLEPLRERHACALFPVLADGRAWVAYVLGHAGSGHGYATEAVAAMLQHLFKRLGVHQAMASVEEANARSIALLARLGFSRALGDALQGHELTATEQLWLQAAPR